MRSLDFPLADPTASAEYISLGDRVFAYETRLEAAQATDKDEPLKEFRSFMRWHCMFIRSGN